jgi:ABC-2 type transport system ATP-binding protein
MLMGLVRPDAGAIEILGYRGRRIGVRQKQRIGYISQEQHFYPWMTCVGLGRFVAGLYPTWDDGEFHRLLYVFDLPPHRKVSQLSGGMRIKLALALALSHRPPILILDEPTSGLDPVARREFLEIVRLQARQHQRTTFFSSHLVDEVERVADRVGIIHYGRLRFEGSIDALRASVREVAYDDPAGATDAAAAHPTREQVLQLAETHGLTLLREGLEGRRSLLLDGEPSRWDAASFPANAVRQLSLEDIFIAMASEVPLSV